MNLFQFGCWIFPAGLVLGCGGVSPRATTPTEPPAAVEAVLTRWYEAIQHHDSAGIAAPLAPSFFIFEDTTVIERAALIEEIVKSAAMGYQTAALSGFRTVMTDSIAWTSFRNREVWTPTGGKPDTLDFLESAVFQKWNGQWLMERYHATRVNR